MSRVRMSRVDARTPSWTPDVQERAERQAHRRPPRDRPRPPERHGQQQQPEDVPGQENERGCLDHRNAPGGLDGPRRHGSVHGGDVEHVGRQQVGDPGHRGADRHDRGTQPSRVVRAPASHATTTRAGRKNRMLRSSQLAHSIAVGCAIALAMLSAGAASGLPRGDTTYCTSCPADPTARDTTANPISRLVHTTASSIRTGKPITGRPHRAGRSVPDSRDSRPDPPGIWGQLRRTTLWASRHERDVAPPARPRSVPQPSRLQSSSRSRNRAASPVRGRLLNMTYGDGRPSTRSRSRCSSSSVWTCRDPVVPCSR